MTRAIMLLLAAWFAVMWSANSYAAGNHVIHTGGPGGAYYKTFCPPLPKALRDAQFPGYQCVPSEGTVANIKAVTQNLADIGFVQLDVYAKMSAEDPNLLKQTTVIRSLACEGLWVVTKNSRIKQYSDIFPVARRITLHLPGQNSGPAATFTFMKTLDPKGIGMIQDRNIRYDNDVSAMLERVANSPNGDIGMFVQFADPENSNIKKMLDLSLTVIPVQDSVLLNAKVGDKEVYQLQEFKLREGWFAGKSAVTSCTPTAIITGNPEAVTDPVAQADQKDLIAAVGLPDSALLPLEPRYVTLMNAMKRVSGQALAEAMAAADKAKKAALELSN